MLQRVLNRFEGAFVQAPLGAKGAKGAKGAIVHWNARARVLL